MSVETIKSIVIIAGMLVPFIGNAVASLLRKAGKTKAALAVDKATAFSVAKLHEPEKVVALIEQVKALESDHSAQSIAKAAVAARALEGDS